MILYEKYKYLMQKVAMDVLHDSFLVEDAVYNAFISVANNLDKLDEIRRCPNKMKEPGFRNGGGGDGTIVRFERETGYMCD